MAPPAVTVDSSSRHPSVGLSDWGTGVGAESLWVGDVGWKVGWGMGAPSQLQSSTETGQAGAGVTHPEGSSQCGVRGSEEPSSRGRLVPKEPASGPGSSSGLQTWAEGPWAPPCVLRSRGPQVLPSWLAPSCPHGGGSLASAGSTEQVGCMDAAGPCAHAALAPAPRAHAHPPRSARRRELRRVPVPLPALERRRGLRRHAGGVLHGPRLPRRGGHVRGPGRPPVGARLPPPPRVWCPGAPGWPLAEPHASTGLKSLGIPHTPHVPKHDAAADLQGLQTCPLSGQPGRFCWQKHFHASRHLFVAVHSAFLFIHRIWSAGSCSFGGTQAFTEFPAPRWDVKCPYDTGVVQRRLVFPTSLGPDTVMGATRSFPPSSVSPLFCPS